MGKGMDQIVNINKYLSFIIKRLKSIKPYQVILFGSWAYGEPTVDSDVDLIVVLAQRGIARTYQEKYQKRMLVGQRLLEIEREISLDTLVYTLDEWELFLKQGSSFSKIVKDKGVVLYEGHNEGMAHQSV